LPTEQGLEKRRGSFDVRATPFHMRNKRFMHGLKSSAFVSPLSSCKAAKLVADTLSGNIES
jgi:hypothetical protein